MADEVVTKGDEWKATKKLSWKKKEEISSVRRLQRRLCRIGVSRQDTDETLNSPDDWAETNNQLVTR